MALNILFIVPYVPNLIRVRPYNLIRGLSERGNRVTVLTLWSDQVEKDSVEQLKGHADRVIALHLPRWRTVVNSLSVLPTQEPIQMAYCWHPAFAARIGQVLQGAHGHPPFDAVHIEHLRGARYGLYLRSLANHRMTVPPVIWDSVDSISLLFRQAKKQSKSLLGLLVTKIEHRRTERYEGRLLGQFDRVVVTSGVDRQAFLGLAASPEQHSRLAVIPNGVDLNYFKPDPRINREPATLVITGKMSYHANITMVHNFVQDVLPLVWRERPDVKLWIVGKEPPSSIRRLHRHPNIHVTGTVVDVACYLQKATISVAPVTYGSGIQNKVLEAMACGTPIIASPKAVSAIGALAGRDLLVAEDPINFAKEIVGLLANHEHRQRIGEAGRCFVEKHHNWSNIAAQFESLYLEQTLRRASR